MSVSRVDLQLDEQFGALIDALDDQGFDSPERVLLPEEFLRDPFPNFHQIRDRFGPVVDRAVALEAGLRVPNCFLLDESKPMFVVVGYDAAAELWRRGEEFLNYPAYEHSLGTSLGNIVGIMDGAEHTRYRNLIMQAFRRSHVERWSEELVRPVAAFLIGRIQADGAGDLVRDLAAPMPFWTTTHIMGLKTDDLGPFIKLTADLIHIAYDHESAMAAKEHLGEYFAAQIEDRRSHPGGSDLISLLVEAEMDGQRLTDEAIIDNLRFLLPAGIETTYRSLSNQWGLLMTHPEQYRAVCRNPDLINPAVEEALRLEGPAFSTPRVAAHDLELCGVSIPEGAGVYALQGAANRDPARWPDPDTFDITRKRQPHAAFIAGPHTCIGMHLARLQMQQSLRTAIESAPDLRLTVPADSLGSIGYMLRAYPSCPVTA